MAERQAEQALSVTLASAAMLPSSRLEESMSVKSSVTVPTGMSLRVECWLIAIRKPAHPHGRYAGEDGYAAPRMPRRLKT